MRIKITILIFIPFLLLNISCKQDPLTEIVNKIADHRLIEQDTISHFSNSNDLRILRNTVFASYGYSFSSKDLQDYFAKYSWYKPNQDFSEFDFTKVDQKNLSLIAYHEYDTKITNIKSAPLKEPLSQQEELIVGNWLASPVASTGGDPMIIFLENRVVQYLDTPDCLSRNLTKIGNWKIENNELILKFDTEGTLTKGTIVQAEPFDCVNGNQKIIEGVPILRSLSGNHIQVTKSNIQNLYNTEFQRNVIKINGNMFFK